MGTERPCIGVLLAGGQSRRMGCDKAQLVWQGQSLLEYQVDTLKAAGVNRVLVSGERPEQAGICDRVPVAGPLAGLASVALAVQEDADLLVIPVDMPRLEASLLQRLRMQQPQAVCLAFVDQVLPLRFRCDRAGRALLARLAAATEPRQRSLRKLQQVAACARLSLSASEAMQLIDCNTPETWQEITRCASN